MYNTNYICTYNKSDIFLKEEEEVLCEEEKLGIREELYRQDILNILNLEEYDGKLMDTEMHNLYKRVKCCEFLEDCMAKLAASWLSEDEEIGLMILYSYDYMYATHICVSEYLVSGKISYDNSKLLKDLL